ncbi:MAG: S1 family peptidase [Minisyncoccota bacterium]
MSRFAPYFSMVLMLLVGAFVVSFSSDSVVISSAPPTASSTISVVPNSNLSSTTVSSQPSSKEATTTVVVQKKHAPKETPSLAKTAVSKTPQAAVPVPAPTPSPSAAELDTASRALRGALVNILCYAPAGSPLHSILGSGVFIDSKGIILTNAHVAQYFLLADRGVSCTIRTGSPAVDTYKASLIYLSPAWAHANAHVLTQVEPIGTGEYDFALLAVTRSTTGVVLPATFPFVPLSKTPSTIGTPVIIASYGAQFLATNQIQSSLFPTIVFGSVKDVYTFAVNSTDILALGGSAAAQEGSSGGGVADASGSLVGSITTSTIQGATDTRSLYAITSSYIRSEYAREMGSPLDTLLSQSTDFSVNDFAPKIPTLEAVITTDLP